ncbi:MAG: 50S ribosomal protein L3 [archaeon]
MGTTRNPRRGSLQFWPRKRANRPYARIRNYGHSKECKILGFAGYKVGMSHVIAVDNYKFSPTKGSEIAIPVTIIECPPIKVAAVRLYKKSNALNVAKEVWSKVDKELERKIIISKKANHTLEGVNPDDYSDIRLLVYTQPKETGVGKKRPELFEAWLSGSVKEKFDYAKFNLGKEIPLKNVFKDGQLVDVHSITKGKGFQGPVKRFGVMLRSHKSEKSTRFPGSLGSWKAQAHIMWRVAFAGKTGYHQRTEYNKHIIKIGDSSTDITPKGGFLKYGNVKSTYLLLKGSIPGPKKRMVIFTSPVRPTKKVSDEAKTITYISNNSKQGR